MLKWNGEYETNRCIGMATVRLPLHGSVDIVGLYVRREELRARYVCVSCDGGIHLHIGTGLQTRSFALIINGR